MFLRMRCGFRNDCFRNNFNQIMMISKYEKKEEPSLYQCPVTLKTSTRETIRINAVFMDTQPSGSQKGTVIVIHGTPGSHKDFKYVTPHLVEKNIRVIGINFPGLGYSSGDQRLNNDGNERNKMLQQIVDVSRIDNGKLVFMGHSRGCPDTLRICAENKDKCSGVIVINPVGFRPHRAARPFYMFTISAWLWEFTLLRPILAPFFRFVYKMLGLRVTNQTAGICMQIMSHTDFAGQKKFVEIINNSNVRVLIPFAGKDNLIEPEISRELAGALEHNEELSCSAKGEDERIITATVNAFQSGKKHISVFFENEDHFLQKHRGKFLACAAESILLSSKKNK